VYLGNEPVNIHQLGAKVHAQLKKAARRRVPPLRRKVPFGIFASVVDTLRQSGISNISIVTEPITDRARTQ